MKNKRDLLKGVGLSLAWSTPVVQSVVLPAHGSSTSCVGLSAGPTQTFTVACSDEPFDQETCYTICESFSGTSETNFVVIPCEQNAPPTQLSIRVQRISAQNSESLDINLIGPEVVCGNDLGSTGVNFDCDFDQDVDDVPMITGLEDAQGNCYRINGTHSFDSTADTLTLSPLTAERIG